MNATRNTTPAEIFDWRDDYALGHAAMDETHREFVACVDALLRAEDAALALALAAFEVHARRHFAEEDLAMQQSAYGSAGCHIDEHAAILRSLDEVNASLQQGHVHVVRAFGQALADWFPEHARVMDMGLARWLTQRRLGGSPVLICPRALVAAA
ncbi:bacteriohemerythrin [Variovorax boronicumulans]|uniref:bacteriohemerythrin n=1 Tax=Variovorax boronicumulans TaxID=436515 RepID=UPI001C5708DB